MSHARLIGAIRAVVAAFVVFVFVLASAPAASADTAVLALVTSSPRDGDEMALAPSQVELHFSEALRPGGDRVIVLGPSGASYQSGPARIVDNKLTQPLAPLGPSGTYRVDFRVVVADGHTLSETIAFTLTKPGPAAGAALPSGPHMFTQPVETALTDAPPWAPWAVGAVALILVFGALLFGRRATHGRG
ncbi:MAG TPA: copper resistance CopC family protein [Pseudonocardiaceae bacterium]|nr:copper resistance CopC family protein [Pseudonocardiaceae bacterium]